MLISLQELEQHRVDFQEEIGADVIDFGQDIHQLQPLRSSGHAELVEERRGHRERTGLCTGRRRSPLTHGNS